MQFDKDINGKCADIFLKLREILLSYEEMTELKNAKQTSYRDSYGVVAMMRDRDDKFVVSLGKGVALQKKYPFLEGEGKIVRHLYFQSLEDVDEGIFREIIEESLILNMEAFELKMLRKSL
ncbi:MAG: hypothetical protein KAG56_00370 [Sulfurovaceae bacterium]|nr:hypothetical protein [Sulfurovaceae bacterium]